MITNMPDIHPTMPHTGAAAVAALCIHLYSYEAETIEQTVDGTKRAYKAAEAPIAENTCRADDDHDDKLACEKYAKHTEQVAVARV